VFIRVHPWLIFFHPWRGRLPVAVALVTAWRIHHRRARRRLERVKS
jgi:hypothetical protein